MYDGIRPYQQVPFQYSLHYLERDGAELGHKEFLADENSDPRRALAERLVADIPTDACVLAYNMSFERTRLKELAEIFPDLSEKLLAIRQTYATYWTYSVTAMFTIVQWRGVFR